MRAAASVTHYVLLGETDDGCCGVPWGTCQEPKPSPNPSPNPNPNPGPHQGVPWGTWGFMAGEEGGGSCSVSSTSSDSSGDAEEAEEGEGAEEEDEEGEAWRRVYADSPQRTPWGAEGWSRRELSQLSQLQICRTDAPWCATRHSRTTVFTRGYPP